jgi:hypothetical protein
MIEAEPAAAGADAELAAIEAGAQDLEPGDEEGTTLFITDPTDLDLVSRALPAQGFTVLSAKLGYKPKNPVDPASLSAEQLEEVEAFLAAIDGNDDVQNVPCPQSGDHLRSRGAPNSSSSARARRICVLNQALHGASAHQRIEVPFLARCLRKVVGKGHFAPFFSANWVSSCSRNLSTTRKMTFSSSALKLTWRPGGCGTRA